MIIGEQFPLTVRALKQEDIEHIQQLESGWKSKEQEKDEIQVSGTSDKEFDVILIGGGLSLLYAVYFAKAGFEVAVVDRGRAGKAHREWNVSYKELTALERAELLSPEELDELINARYQYGIVRWHNGEEHRVNGVLDCALNADLLLSKLREKAESMKVQFFDNSLFQGKSVSADNVTVNIKPKEEAHSSLISGRLLLDGRGAQSGYGEFDIVCPTVGGVLSGLEQGSGECQVDSTVGEILISTEGIEDGRQHIWEGFPTAKQCMTTYLFYYVEPHRLGQNPLLSLYERFFAKLNDYKRGEPLVEKATYGFIPGNTRLRTSRLSPQARVYLVGDAAGTHSPLTFCGFGSLIRSFQSIADQLIALLKEDELNAVTLNQVKCEKSGLRVMGGLALMMIGSRVSNGNLEQINSLLDDAFSVLAGKGDHLYRQFMQDDIQFYEFLDYMLSVARRRPRVWQEVFERMSLAEIKEYALQMTKFGLTG